jgi:uncharacterized protein (DUF1778 family)
MLLQTFIDSLIDKANLSVDKEFSKQACQTITCNDSIVGNIILAFDEQENIISGSLSTNKQYYVFNTPDDDDGIQVEVLEDFIEKANQLSSTGVCDNLVSMTIELDDETRELLERASVISGRSVEQFLIDTMTALADGTIELDNEPEFST